MGRNCTCVGDTAGGRGAASVAAPNANEPALVFTAAAADDDGVLGAASDDAEAADDGDGGSAYICNGRGLAPRPSGAGAPAAARGGGKPPIGIGDAAAVALERAIGRGAPEANGVGAEAGADEAAGAGDGAASGGAGKSTDGV